jgi:hypothetical protein
MCPGFYPSWPAASGSDRSQMARLGSNPSGPPTPSRLDIGERRATGRDGTEIRLTPKQWRLLEALARRAGTSLCIPSRCATRGDPHTGAR